MLLSCPHKCHFPDPGKFSAEHFNEIFTAHICFVTLGNLRDIQTVSVKSDMMQVTVWTVNTSNDPY